jgi:hypothetical protein
MRSLFPLFAVSAVVMGISHTIAKERICEPLRQKLGGKETWLGYLVSCPYCASHWVAFVVVPLTGAYYVDLAIDVPVLSPFLRWFFSCVLIATIAAFLRVAFYFVDESQGLVRREQVVKEKEAEALPAVMRASIPVQVEGRKSSDAPH